MQTRFLSMKKQYGTLRKLFTFLILFLAYAFIPYVSHGVYNFNSPALFWPTAGIGLAILFLEGMSLWPAIFFASFLVSVVNGIPFFGALFLAIGYSFEAVIGAYLLKRYNFSPLLAHLRDVIILILVSISISSIGTAFSCLTLLLSDISLALLKDFWEPWWLGNILSNIVISAFIMRWFVRYPNLSLSNAKLIQWWLSFITLTTVCYFVFWTPYTHIGSVPLIYAILGPLIWMTIYIGPRGVTLALLIMTALSTTGVFLGTPTEAATHMALNTQLIQTEIFNLIIGVTFLIFASSEKGRRIASLALQEHIGKLENALRRISLEDQAKNEFLAILAHELRNPLAPIMSSIELMRIHGTDPTEAAELLNTMDDQVRTMARLLDDLLDISRISQKKFKLQKNTVDFNSILRRSAQTAGILMQNRNHTLLINLPAEPIWISADPVRLEQVMINLLNNAAKYTEPGGTISLFAAVEKNVLTIKVKDNGVGIPSDMIGRIFEPFLQVEQSRRSEGLGIGLSLAKRLVEMHRGTISATSDGAGHGSEFIVQFTLPLSSKLPPPPQNRLLQNQPAPSLPLSIFLVDDNKLAADGLAKLLIYKGHKVTTAYNGASALEVAPTLSPDVIVLDIGLPDMDGYTVITDLKDKGVQAYFVALTGYGREDDKLKAKQAGFDRHLTKPVALADLESALEHVKPHIRY